MLISTPMPILVTRPEPGATRTANDLKDLGFEPVIISLTKTTALKHNIQDLNFEDLMGSFIVATSEAAFLHLNEQAVLQLKQLPLYCVGTRTATAAKARGFNNIIVVAKTAAELVEKLALMAGHKFLYLAGKIRRPDLEIAMAKTHQLQIVEVYNTESVAIDELALSKISNPVAAVLLYSGGAAKALGEIKSVLCAETVLMCLSMRIAAEIPHSIKNVPVIAYQPNEAAMMAGIVQIFS